MDNFDLMRERLRARGGIAQQARMIKDKQESLKRAIKYSYQGAQVQALGKTDPAVALINPNAVKQDYDDKTISIDFSYGYSVGTIFEWVNTNTKWLIYLQDLTELAFFHGDIRRCNYQIKWKKQDDTICSTYGAVRGPKESKIDSSTAGHASLDVPNNTLNILIPNTPDTREYFVRYNKFYLQEQIEENNPICWRIEAVDSISTPGILEVSAYEYYIDEHQDNVEEGLVGDLVIEPEVPNTDELIQGNTFIKPGSNQEYTYVGEEDASWEWIGPEGTFTPPIEAQQMGKTISIKWVAMYSGQFELRYGSSSKTIVVESLF